MALTVEEFKAVWNRKAETIRAEAAEAIADDSRPQDLALLLQRIEAVDAVWTANAVDEWPAAPQEALDALRVTVDIRRIRTARELDPQARQTLLAEAFELLDQIEKQIGAQGKLRTQANEIYERARAMGKLLSKELRKKTQDATDDDPAIAALTQRVAALKTEHSAAAQARNSGQYDAAIVAFKSVIGKLDQALTDLKMMEFAEFQTLAIDQGAYVRPSGDRPALGEVDSKGVCQAMVLDFLSVGGSHQEAGDVLEAQITSRHFQEQQAYNLNSSLRRMKGDAAEKFGLVAAAADLDDHVTASQASIDTATNAVQDWTQYITGLDAQIAESTRMVQARRESVMNIARNLPDSDPSKQQMMQAVAQEIDDWERQLQGQQQQKQNAEATLAEWQAHLGQLQTAHAALLADQSDAVQAVWDLIRKTTTLIDAGLALQAAFAQKRAMNGPMLPSAVLDAFGVSLDAGSAEKTEPADATLTEAEVVAAITQYINRLPDGETGSLQISVQMDAGGHAIALRVTKPGGTITDWDIELFDPNANGYRFDDLGKFTGFMPKFYKSAYASVGYGWTSMTLSKITVDAQTAPTDPQSLIGPGVADAWQKDWDAVKAAYTQVKTHNTLPTLVINEIEGIVKKIESLFPVHDPASGTQVDLQVARTYLMQLSSACATALDEQSTYDMIKGAAMAQIASHGNEAARECYATALTLHVGGEFQAATVRLNYALENCEIQEWQDTRDDAEAACLAAIKAYPDRATEFRGILGFADAAAEAGTYDKALASLDRLTAKIAEARAAAEAALSDAMRQWQTAREAAVLSLRQLDACIQASAHSDAGEASRQIKAIVANLTPRPATRAQVDEIASYLNGDEVIAEIESPNPFGVTIELRRSLADPLNALKADLTA